MDKQESYLANLDNIIVRLVPIHRIHVVQFDIEYRSHSGRDCFISKDVRRLKEMWIALMQRAVSRKYCCTLNCKNLELLLPSLHKLLFRRAYQTPSLHQLVDWLKVFVISYHRVGENIFDQSLRTFRVSSGFITNRLTWMLFALLPVFLPIRSL